MDNRELVRLGQMGRWMSEEKRTKRRIEGGKEGKQDLAQKGDRAVLDLSRDFLMLSISIESG